MNDTIIWRACFLWNDGSETHEHVMGLSGIPNRSHILKVISHKLGYETKIPHDPQKPGFSIPVQGGGSWKITKLDPATSQKDFDDERTRIDATNPDHTPYVVRLIMAQATSTTEPPPEDATIDAPTPIVIPGNVNANQ